MLIYEFSILVLRLRCVTFHTCKSIKPYIANLIPGGGFVRATLKNLVNPQQFEKTFTSDEMGTKFHLHSRIVILFIVPIEYNLVFNCLSCCSGAC